VPNHWINRKTGKSKLKIQEMGSRYMFIVLYCFIEKWLSRGDYNSGKANSKKRDRTIGRDSTAQKLRVENRE
jgi:dolichol-phosphate mannosyltransferase